jgi:hypothetical protein
MARASVLTRAAGGSGATKRTVRPKRTALMTPERSIRSTVRTDTPKTSAYSRLVRKRAVLQPQKTLKDARCFCSELPLVIKDLIDNDPMNARPFCEFRVVHSPVPHRFPQPLDWFH